MLEVKQINSINELLELEKKGELEGLYKISDEIYFDNKCPGISRSMLNNFAISPRYYKINEIDNQKAPTEAMEFGKAFHAAMEDFSNFRETYEIVPEFKGVRGNTKAQQLEKWKLETGKLPIEKDELVRIDLMKDQIKTNKNYQLLFDGALHEITFFAKDKLNGILLKGKVDLCKYDEENNYLLIGDYKTCQPLFLSNEKKIQNEILYGTSRLFYQYSFYRYLGSLLGYASDFAFIFIEKDIPFGMRIINLEHEFYSYGLEKMFTELADFAECKKYDTWPDYETNLTISLPTFLK